jgi:hypothetical protein
MQTLEDIAKLPQIEISPAQVVSVTGGDAQLLRLQARYRPCDVPFKFRFNGRNMRINKHSFLEYYGYTNHLRETEKERAIC